MNYQSQLIKGYIQKRYKRFLADIKLESGELITAHTPNTGSMKSCGKRSPVLLSFHDDPKRKLKYTLELIYKRLINVYTSKTNHIAIEAIEKNVIKELDGYEHLRPVKIGNSRIDILLYDGEQKYKEASRKCYVEVKNVTPKKTKRFFFPDGVSTRGQKHLKELIEIKKSGDEGHVICYLKRGREYILPAELIDPEYANLLKEPKILA